MDYRLEYLKDVRILCIDKLREDLSQGFKGSRELSLVMTKLDEAALWLTRCEVIAPEETKAGD